MSSEGSEVVRLEQRVPFTMVDNPIIRALDDYVALGLYVDMLSWPAGWRINLRELSRTHKQGRQVLTAAMNDLIERGLVFRVRYQQAGGLWMTRTYVCASPVTEAELLEVKANYLGRCRIETSAALSLRLNPRAAVGEDPVSSSEPAVPAPNHGEEASPDPRLVTSIRGPSPSARFRASGAPGVGEAASGQRDVGHPTIGRRARQRSDPRPKIPPPTPPPDVGERVDAAQAVGEGAAAEPASSVDDRLVEALLSAWPTLSPGTVSRLEPDLAAAVGEIGYERLVEHLTTNTGGAVSAAAVLRTRLRDLPRVRSKTMLPAWCGECSSPEYRWIEGTDGLPVHPCSRCSAQAAAGKLAGRRS